MRRLQLHWLLVAVTLLMGVLTSCEQEVPPCPIPTEKLRIDVDKNFLEFPASGGEQEIKIYTDNKNIAGIVYGDLMPAHKNEHRLGVVYTWYWEFTSKMLSSGDFLVWDYCLPWERPAMLAKGVKMMNEQDFWSGTKCKFSNLQFEKTDCGLKITAAPNKSEEETVLTVCLESVGCYINDMILIRQQGSPQPAPEQ